MIGIKFSEKKVKRRLQAMQRRIKHDEPAMRTSALIMWKDQLQHFKDERASRGRWKRLKKPRRRGGTKVLQDTGILRASIRYRGIRHDAIVWTGLKYAKTHQYGDSSRGIPKREFLWLSKTARKKAMTVISKFIIGR